MIVINQEFEKLIILNMFEVTLNKFKESYVYVGSSSHPKYCNGYLLYFSAMDDTEYNQRMQVEKKTMIWDYLEYVKMEKFERVLKNKDDNSGIIVQDMSSSRFFNNIVKFLKSKENQK